MPTTLLSAADDTEVVVCELGARGLGHIALLCEVVRPTVGVVTNVGTAHAEMYADGAAGIALAKGELVAALPADGTAVLNADDAATPGLVARTAARVLTFGLAGRAGTTRGPDVAVLDPVLDAELRPAFRLVTPWGTADVRLEVRGAHQAANAAAAAAAALAVGAPLEAVAAGLGAARLSPWRMELARTPDGITVVNDAYNANPESVAAALDALAALAVVPPGRRVAVLGPMAELGGGCRRASRRGERAARLGVDTLVVVGDAAAGIAEGFGGAGRTHLVADAAGALAALGGELAPGDAVLVKASRVAGLERVAGSRGLAEPMIASSPPPAPWPSPWSVTPALIRALIAKGIGQQIRSDGPQAHQTKARAAYIRFSVGDSFLKNAASTLTLLMSRLTAISSRVMSWPKTSTLPCSTVRRVLTRRMNVDLPLPLAPRRP